MSLHDASTSLIRVTIASYDLFIADGLASSLRAREEFSVRQTIVTKEAFEHTLLKQDVDVLLIHPKQVDASLYESLSTLGAIFPRIKKLLLLPREDLREYLSAINMDIQGALIYRMMTPGDLFHAIREIHRGKYFIAPFITNSVTHVPYPVNPLLYDPAPRRSVLTAREIELLSCLVEGLSNRQIAEKLHVEMKTVKNHLTNIYSKLQVQNRLEAVVHYYKISSARKHAEPIV
ncbi:MAG TPA: response regulator transcription factor [Ktedonobacteraceae bacterium]|nr:response regulator transcription factor [Ktedonobacteraceae bacterium]